MKVLGRDEILTADDLPTRLVDCPEWGGAVRLRCLTGAERDAWEGLWYSRKQKDKFDARNLRASLVAACAVDDEGELLFAPADIEALGAKCAAPLDRLFETAQNLSGLTDEDVDELEGN